MNIIDESFAQKQKTKKDNTKLITRIVLAIIIIVVIAIIGIGIAMYYIQESQLKVYFNGQVSPEIKNLLQFDSDGTIYVPIRDIATYFGYESYSGDYNDLSEDRSKCYIQSEDEVASFSLNSNTIYKLKLNSTSSTGENYEYFYLSKPIKATDGKLYMSQEGIPKAFNATFTYNKDTNRVYIYTMSYLIQTYTNSVLDYGYTGIEENFDNYKAVLNNMLVVKKDNKFGVINPTTGETIIEPKYDGIEYLENTNNFLVKSNNKVGVLSNTGELKIQILYDSLELMDSDAGLYLAKRDGKSGMIDIDGNIKIHIEYDQIGIDVTQFSNNEIKNKFILVGNLIPVKKDNYWGFFDTTGKQIVEFKYDNLGYIASGKRDAMNLLVIPDYEVVVVRKDNKYGLVDKSGNEIVRTALDDAYLTISGGEKYYMMTYNDETYDIEKYFEENLQ